jgi:predicted transcriptional regulator
VPYGDRVFALLGVPEAEERAYLLLVERPGLSRPDIAKEMGCTAAEARSILRSLEEQNFIWQSAKEEGMATYSAVSPKVALRAALLRRQQELADIELTVEQLAERYDRQGRGESPELLIEIIKGRDAIARTFGEFLETARSEVLILERPPYAADPRGENHAATQERLRETGDPPHRVLVDKTAFDLPGRFEIFMRDASDAGELRTHARVPLKMVIADGERALLPLRLEPRAVEVAALIYPSTLLEALVALFELLWTQGTPFPAQKLAKQRFDPTKSHRPTLVTNEAVLSLLAAGLKDESIARSLDISRRTVDRRIQDMMHEGGISTRFQLGFVASERGWLEETSEP